MDVTGADVTLHPSASVSESITMHTDNTLKFEGNAELSYGVINVDTAATIDLSGSTASNGFAVHENLPLLGGVGAY